MHLPSGSDLATLGKIGVAAGPTAATFLGLLRGPGSQRANLTHDIALLDKLPEGTEPRAKFERYLAAQIDRFAAIETEGSRDVSGLVISVLLVGALLAAALWLADLNEWWSWVIAVPLAMFAMAGVSSAIESSQKVVRTSRDAKEAASES